MGMPVGATSISGANPPITKNDTRKCCEQVVAYVGTVNFLLFGRQHFCRKVDKTGSERADTRH